MEVLQGIDPFSSGVHEVEGNRSGSWSEISLGDGLGSRTYLLEKSNLGTTFTRTEKIGGLLFPLFISQIPTFDKSFEQFAADLKKEAEIIANSK